MTTKKIKHPSKYKLTDKQHNVRIGIGKLATSTFGVYFSLMGVLDNKGGFTTKDVAERLRIAEKKIEEIRQAIKAL